MRNTHRSKVKRITHLVGALLCTSCLYATAATTSAQQDMELIKSLGIKESPTASRDHPNWKRPSKIHVAPAFSGRTEVIRSLEAVSDGIPVVPLEGSFRRAADPGYLSELEVLIGHCFPDLLTNAPRLNWVHSLSVGVDACNREKGFLDSRFLLTNNKRTVGPVMAEHGIAMLLSMTRRLHHFRDNQHRSNWERSSGSGPLVEVRGKTMLVVGLGGIGTEVARRASALGMRVLATRNSSREGPDFVEYVGLSDELLDLAKQAHVVVNALPLTKQTEGIFNARFFEQLPEGSYFISLGRGKSTVTDDLIVALENGTLAGAALDVTDPEPLPSNHKLWKMENVIITPHISSRSEGGLSARWTVARENLRRYVRGEPMLNVVDKEKGY